jgi:ADP-dependent glucokinase
VNSIGLNEQELLFASYAANGPHSNYFKEIDGVPDLRKVVDIIEWVLLTHGKNSKLTRVHFHYLLYHIIAINDDYAWSNTESALLSGTKIASKQACDYDFDANENDDFHSKIHYRINTKQFQIDENQYIEIDPTNPVMRFQRNNIKFYLTPVLVCKKPIKTVGLGDAISSTGLLFSQFKAHEKSSY